MAARSASPLDQTRIALLPAMPSIAAGLLESRWSGEIIACDCYVAGAEDGREAPGGYTLGRIVNVDHHAPTARMARPISSANLALERLASVGPPGSDAQIVVTHTDCDSILSAGLMSGWLAPDPEYGAAAVAADHTGAEHPIADLLQALDPLRDVELSLAGLAALCSGSALPPAAAGPLAERHRKRAVAAAAVADGTVRVIRGLAVGRFDHALDGEFFPALLPDASLIVLASPLASTPDRLEVKLRLGAAARAGLTLHALRVRDLDPAFGGRWNAGSNKRGGGTALSLDAYASFLADRLASWTPQTPAGRAGEGPIRDDPIVDQRTSAR